jgi:hypothetical protein
MSDTERNAGNEAQRPDLAGASAAYFGLVFGAGFVLGTLRVLLVEPALGERLAELSETPLMLLVVYFAARWSMGRFSVPARLWPRLQTGCTALVLLVIAEWVVVVFVRQMTAAEYFASRDPVAGTVYLASLAVFALMPVLLSPCWRRRGD